MKRTLALAAICTLGFAACGGSDISPDTLTKALTAQGIEESVAECISADLSDQLSEDDFNQVAKAEQLDELPAELEATTMAVVTECLTNP